jgi:hypothetical protein
MGVRNSLIFIYKYYSPVSIHRSNIVLFILYNSVPPIKILVSLYTNLDFVSPDLCLYCLVVRVLDYRSGGLGSIPVTIKKSNGS